MLGGRGSGRPGMVGLYAAEGDNRIGATGENVGEDELQLPYFVAAETERDGVVALDQNARRTGSEYSTKPRRLLERRRLRQQRDTRDGTEAVEGRAETGQGVSVGS